MKTFVEMVRERERGGREDKETFSTPYVDYTCNIHIIVLYMFTLFIVYLVPDIHIDAKLSAVHLMLDKRQLEIIKGLIDMNLGEHIEEFEKPSSVILDPVAQVCMYIYIYLYIWYRTCTCTYSDFYKSTQV